MSSKTLLTNQITMCVIIIKQKNNVMPTEIAKNSARINPHGLGIIWLDTFEVTYHKSKEYKQLITERPFIAHFRYATVGAINKENTHPFVCGRNTDEMLMMNGTIKGLGNDKVCDSKALAIQLGSKARQTWKTELEQYDCRFVTVNLRTRSFQIYNRNLYTYRDGIWYSKDNVLQENLIAVYGTLKKGFSNYFRYLKNAKYIGRGTTAEKYPLVVKGLPYLVDKKGVGHNVVVDLFKVSDSQLKSIDALEGHPRWYVRKQIKVTSQGRTYTAWTYFNPQEITPSTELHKSFKHHVPQAPSLFESDVDLNETHTTIEYGWDDNDFPTSETPTCIDCYGDVEFDGFSNYYCSSCGGWFKEDEVLKYQS